MEGLVNMKHQYLKNLDFDTNLIINNLEAESIERFSDKRILITGACGFLGVHFINFFMMLNDRGLIKKKCNILAYDNLIRGTPEWVSQLGNRHDFFFENIDVIKKIDYPNVDFIIHAASIASPTFYRMFPIETMDVNVIGLRNLLNHSILMKPESFLFFSTSEIYGDPDAKNIPTKEDYRGNVSCTGPRACYDESKRYGETLCKVFFQEKKLPIKIARPFNNYGPGLDINDKRVLPDFFNNVINGKDIEIYSDGCATRTYTYISDAITGYLKILLSEFNGEEFNIGADKPEISVKDLAELVLKISKSNKSIKLIKNLDVNYLVDNPNRRCPDISKAKMLLNFEPKFTLEQGLKRTYEFYLENSNIKFH